MFFNKKESGNALPLGLAASAIIAFVSILGMIGIDITETYEARMYILPEEITVSKDEPFTIKIMIDAEIPTNVYTGEIDFDTTKLDVAHIDYNTSVADLWAEKPWYSNGKGTINFAGGTTRPGGFTGSDQLITITFTSHIDGKTALTLRDTRILLHDGLGTDAALQPSIDTLISITDTTEVVASKQKPSESILYVLPNSGVTDLNDDGKQTLLDLSIFMGHLASGNKRSDFNNDGKVNTSDLSILLNAQ